VAGPTTARCGGRRVSPPGPLLRPAGRGPRMPCRRALALAVAAAVLLGAAVAWLLYGSGWLRAERVSVSGTRVLTPTEVRKAAAVPLGTPLAAVDTGAIEHRLLARLPRIASAEVSRSWPHTVRVAVREREPEAVMAEGGRYVEVDADGVRFDTLTARPQGVLVLQMALNGSTSAKRFGEDRLRREGVAVAMELPSGIRRQTSAVRVASYDSITLELTGGRTVMWGSSEGGAAKGRTLTALLKAQPAADHFDVGVPDAPAVSGG
jgi:cell division protein FtsQ